MKNRVFKLLTLLIFVCPTVALSRPALSYSEWKNSMIQVADQRLKLTQINIRKLRESNSTAKNLNNLLLKESKENLQLSMSKELSIADYFVGYLTRQPNIKATIADVSHKMSPTEVSELMQAYANNFFKSESAVQVDLKSATRAGFNQK